MQIFITGGTGFIGKALVKQLTLQGHSVTVLTRQNLRSHFPLIFCHSLSTLKNLNNFDAVINLAGEPIFDTPWCSEQKKILIKSRIDITQQLVNLVKKSENPPAIFISGSATGFYGNCVNNVDSVDEEGNYDHSFTSELCKQWEAVAFQAKSEKTRICILRTGLVLSKEGGILKRILPIYKLGLGGKLGKGKQSWSWISLKDHIRAILFLLENSNAEGIFNLVAPELTKQAEFNRKLAKQLNRPAFCHIPQFLLKIVFGERAQLLLDNQPITPKRLLNQGFEFKDKTLKSYLKEHL